MSTNDPQRMGQDVPPTETEAQAERVALEILRGTTHLLHEHGFASLSEFTLANGRRADTVGIARDGEIWIVEIKSSVADFLSDQKWRDYLEFADRFFFAVRPDFPNDLLPAECGLILADRYGGEIIRTAPVHSLAPARRKAITLKFARFAAIRLSLQLYPALTARSEAKDL